MARKTRLFVADIPYHVIQRGNNKCPIFFSPGDYSFFLEILQEANLIYPCFIYSYCLMPNHFHFLIKPKQKPNISLLMKFIGVKYVYYVNNKYGRTGTLWEGRFKASLVDEEAYFITCLRYIEMNPVRADIVKAPELYRWSSYRFRAFGERSPLVEVDLDPWYNSLGFNTEEIRQRYRGLFQEPISDMILSDIRETTQKGGILGGEKFKKEVEDLLQKDLVIMHSNS